MARLSADERRDSFVAATVRVIARHGVSGATTRRIAEEAGAPLATLHYCFGTKEDLFFTVLQHVADDSAALTVQAADPLGLAKTAVEWLTKAVRWNVTFEDSGGAAFELYFWALRQSDEHPKLAADVYDLFVTRTVDSLQAGLKPGDDESLIVPLARVLIALADGILMQWFGHRNARRRQTDLRLACQMIETFVDRPT